MKCSLENRCVWMKAPNALCVWCGWVRRSSGTSGSRSGGDGRRQASHRQVSSPSLSLTGPRLCVSFDTCEGPWDANMSVVFQEGAAFRSGLVVRIGLRPHHFSCLFKLMPIVSPLSFCAVASVCMQRRTR